MNTSLSLPCNRLEEKNKLNIIVATAKNKVIGTEDGIPWKIPSEMQYFKKITTGEGNNAVIMGRKTFDSIGKPLPNRFNIVLTNQKVISQKGVLYCSSTEDALKLCSKKNVKDIFVIGGSEIYSIFFEKYPHDIDTIYFTLIHRDYNGSVYLPSFQWDNFYLYSSCLDEQDNNVEYLIYKNQKNSLDEYQYLDLIKTTLHEPDLCSFGTMMKFDLQKGFPLLTTKKMFLRGVIEELLWFLRGETNSNILKNKNVHIWDKNGSREYLDSLGLTNRSEGDLGPVYGFNFRHFGVAYKDCHTDYTNQGTDQVKYVLDLIKNKPSSRRILISLWNPSQLQEVALPACHVLYQFKVKGDKLSCCLYQRSGDIGLGIPFNIASASLMTHIFAHLTDLQVGTLTHCIGDAHIYKEHEKYLQKQCNLQPFCFPILKIENRNQKKVEDFESSDFMMKGYISHESIKMPLVV
jgi:dihydrofolate reductase/thymidylate synthase